MSKMVVSALACFAAALASSSALADSACGSSRPSCIELGFVSTSAECAGYEALKCPFGDAYYCGKASGSYSATSSEGVDCSNQSKDCTGLGYTKDASACGSKPKIKCPFGDKYFCLVAAAKSATNCSLGDILGSDDKCYNPSLPLPFDITAKAVVVDPYNRLAVDLEQTAGLAYLTGIGDYIIDQPYYYETQDLNDVCGYFITNGSQGAYLDDSLHNLWHKLSTASHRLVADFTRTNLSLIPEAKALPYSGCTSYDEKYCNSDGIDEDNVTRGTKGPVWYKKTKYKCNSHHCKEESTFVDNPYYGEKEIYECTPRSLEIGGVSHCLYGCHLKDVDNSLSRTTLTNKIGVNNTSALASANGKVVNLGGQASTISTPAAMKCYDKGSNWFLPTIGDLVNLNNKLSAVNAGLSKVGGTSITSGDKLWSSTQLDYLYYDEDLVYKWYNNMYNSFPDGYYDSTKANYIEIGSSSIPGTPRDRALNVRCFYYYGV
ncbi:MAG: hypothetical protein IJ529_05385 [Alphaproteobacteria bacterium]|nr:hypothetical protein [Alphaproteobacteria bacterium]